MYIGSRPRTREVLQRRMYTNEIYDWLAEAKLEEKDSGTGVVSSFDEIGIDDGDVDAEQIILSRNSTLHHRNGVTTSPM